MSFQQGLSGLASSARSLDVIGHNIANANTVGMKSSPGSRVICFRSPVRVSSTQML